MKKYEKLLEDFLAYLLLCSMFLWRQFPMSCKITFDLIFCSLTPKKPPDYLDNPQNTQPVSLWVLWVTQRNSRTASVRSVWTSFFHCCEKQNKSDLFSSTRHNPKLLCLVILVNQPLNTGATLDKSCLLLIMYRKHYLQKDLSMIVFCRSVSHVSPRWTQLSETCNNGSWPELMSRDTSLGRHAICLP